MFISLDIFTLATPRLWHIIQTLSVCYMQTYGIFGQLIFMWYGNPALEKYAVRVYFDANYVMGI